MFNANLQHIYLTATDMNANSSPEKIASTCVCLRTAKGAFSVFPRGNDSLFEDAIYTLDPAVAVKICTPSVQALLKQLPSEEDTFQLDADTTIQVLETMDHLSLAERCQRSALIRDENVLIIWEDNVDRILPLIAELDDKFIIRLWRQPKALGKKSSASSKHSPSFLSLFRHARANAIARLDEMRSRARKAVIPSPLNFSMHHRTVFSPDVSSPRAPRFW